MGMKEAWREAMSKATEDFSVSVNYRMYGGPRELAIWTVEAHIPTTSRLRLA